MSTEREVLLELANREYKAGFVTDIESESIPAGLNEDIVRVISAKKNEPEWLTEWRLKAYRHWLTMTEPTWQNVHYPPIDYQAAVYYSAPKTNKNAPKSLEEVDPKLLETYEKLGIPLRERAKLAGVAVDAVFDSVSVATTFREQLAKVGVIFCSFSEAVQNHPELVKKYLGSVVPYSDNFFATLNSAVFSDGSFVYVPKGVRCPMELSTYFRINAENTGQFERTLIVAEEGAYVSYLEGCTAPMRDKNQLHAAVVELVALDDAQIKYSTVQGLEDLLDPGGDRVGHHLEVSERHLAGRRLGRGIPLGGADQQLPAGRYRHEDDPHRQEHEQHHPLQGDLGRPRAEHLSGPGEDPEGRDRRAQLHAMRLAVARQQLRGP